MEVGVAGGRGHSGAESPPQRRAVCRERDIYKTSLAERLLAKPLASLPSISHPPLPVFKREK